MYGAAISLADGRPSACVPLATFRAWTSRRVNRRTALAQLGVGIPV
jgi:hypothetical protein